MPQRPTADPQPYQRAPLWLRLVVLFVVLWLGVRIVRTVTDTLIAMTHGPSVSRAG